MKDLHIHIERGPYTVSWIENFIERAQQTGMDEICLLEHSIRFRDFHPAFKESREYNSYQRKWFDEKGNINDIVYGLCREFKPQIAVRRSISYDCRCC